MKTKRRKIAAFRPENVLKKSSEKAHRHGFEFFGFAVFELVERRAALKEIKEAFEEGVDMAVFTSLNGIKKSFSICEGDFDLKDKLKGVEVCAIGPATRRELVRYGVRVDFMPEEYSARGLQKLLYAQGGLEAKRIVFLRSAEGGKEIVEHLCERGALVKDIAVYRVQMNDCTEEKRLYSDLVRYEPDYVIFTSSLTFKTFLGLADKFGMREQIRDVLATAKIAAIGDLTAETIREDGMKVDIVADKSTFTDVLKQLKGDGSSI